MKALTWQGRSDVRIDDVPDPRIEHPTDAVIRVTSTAICGSDLHLYDPLGPFLSKGDILGHETMGIVEEVGSEVTHISVGDRVVVLGRAGEAVRATVDVPHPRDPERRGDDATRRLRRTILDALEK